MVKYLVFLMSTLLSSQGNKIALSDLQDILGSMGIELTEKMLSELQESLPVDGKPQRCCGGWGGGGGHDLHQGMQRMWRKLCFPVKTSGV